MGFGNFLKKLTKSPFKATGQLLHGHVGAATKTGITGGGTAPFGNKAPIIGGLGGGGGALQAGLRQILAPSQGAQDYLGSFSPQDQQGIQASIAGNPNGLNDWFSNAQKAGAVPAGPPPPPMPGGGMIEAMPQGGPPPSAPDQGAMDQMKRKFDIARMMGGGGGGRPMIG